MPTTRDELIRHLQTYFEPEQEIVIGDKNGNIFWFLEIENVTAVDLWEEGEDGNELSREVIGLTYETGAFCTGEPPSEN